MRLRLPHFLRRSGEIAERTHTVYSIAVWLWPGLEALMATALFLLVQLVRSKVDWILTACVFVISFLVARIAFSMQRRASLPPALLNPEKEIYKNVDNAFAQLNPPCRVGIERLASVPAMGETELFEYLKNRGFGIPVEEIMEKIKGSALVENAGGLLEIKAAKLKMVTLWLQKHRPQ